MKRPLFILCTCISALAAAQTASFDWDTDGYVGGSGGGTYTDIDGSGIDLVVSGLYNDGVYSSGNIRTGINDMVSAGIVHTYTFQFSQPVNAWFRIGDINTGDNWYDKLAFSGSPVFSNPQSVAVLGSILTPTSEFGGNVNVGYENITSFSFTHGSGFNPATNPGYIVLTNLFFEPALGAGTLQNAVTVKAYPNPASEELYFTFGKPLGELRLTDLSGKELFREVMTTTAYMIDVRAFASGSYLYTYTADGEVVAGKLVLE